MIGLDLVEIERIRIAMLRTPRFRERFFTPEEVRYCDSQADPYQSYAARFAAKEAFRKLHPAFARGIKYHEVEIASGSDGRPFFILHGEAISKFWELDINYIDLSLTHAGQYAMAAAILVHRVKER